MFASMCDFLIDLNRGQYMVSLNTLRNFLCNVRQGYLTVCLRPPGTREHVELQMRCSNLYIIGFHGRDGWYHFDGEEGGWGKNCGLGSNYNNLAQVRQVTLDMLSGL